MKKLLIPLTLLVVSTPLFGQSDLQITQLEGTWSFIKALDGITDENRSRVWTANNDNMAVRWYCFSDGMNILFDLDGYMGGDSDDRVNVTYRFDRTPAVGPTKLYMTTDNKWAYLPMNQITSFTERAKTASNLTVRVTDPLDDEQITYTVSLVGLSKALPRLNDCN